MTGPPTSIFNERYRVVAVEADSLTVRGIVSGKVLTIKNPDPEMPINTADYPPGKVIVLTDLSNVQPN